MESIKNAKHIISSILSNPAYAKLGKTFHTQKSLERLKATLPLSMQQNLVRISYHPHKILFAFSHPSFANEFNRYKIKDIISCLKCYKDEFSEILPIETLQVRGYVPKQYLAKDTQSDFDISSVLAQEICYKEHSKGEFINHASDKDLHGCFEQIRTLIIKLNNNDKNAQ